MESFGKYATSTQKGPKPSIESTTFLLWGSRAKNCATAAFVLFFLFLFFFSPVLLPSPSHPAYPQEPIRAPLIAPLKIHLLGCRITVAGPESRDV